MTPITHPLCAGCGREIEPLKNGEQRSLCEECEGKISGGRVTWADAKNKQKDQLSDRYQLIGTARTVGELRELISMFPDETDFGFINQPLQSLFARRHQDGTVFIGFQ